MEAAGFDPEDARVLIERLADPSSDLSALDAIERALIEFADKLTRNPGHVRALDVESLRSAGLDDRAIHDACAIVAYFAFVNRLADGLGVELES